MSDLQAEFSRDMRSILQREHEIGLNSTRFQQMLEQNGGLGTALLLLQPNRELPRDTFGYLRRSGRLDLSMEFYVVQEKYRPLFSDREREIACWRLDYKD